MPESSVAFAVSRYRPSVTFVQNAEVVVHAVRGEAVGLESWKNSTRVTWPSRSVALAVTSRFVGLVTVNTAPLPGRNTTGGTERSNRAMSPRRRRIHRRQRGS